MPVKLRPAEIVTIQVLSDKGVPNAEITRQLGVTEGTVRYHVHRAALGALEGRRQKLLKAAKHSAIIDTWFRDPEEGSTLTTRSLNVCERFDHLVLEHEFDGTQ